MDIESGDIVYSVFKELDFATSLISGPYARTNFAEAFRRAAAADRSGQDFLADFDRYTPSYEAPASFIASPIFSGARKVGVLVFQMPIDRITTVLSQRTRMGGSGEVYMVGSDRLMRSNSRFSEASTILSQRVDTPGVAAALGGATATATFHDYRGVPVLSAYAPLSIEGVDWAILAEIDEAEAFADVSRLGWFMLLLSLVTAAAVAGAAAWFGRRIAAPIVQASGVANNITAGSLDNVIETAGHDESAELLHALDAMQQDLKRRIQSEGAAAQNARIKTALDSVETAVLATGADGLVIYCNNSATELFSRVAPEIGDPIGSDIAQVLPALQQELGESAQERLEYRWQPGARSIDIVGRQVRDSARVFRGWVLQCLDRTEEIAATEAERARIAAERAVAAENTRIKVALDNVGSAVMVADTDRRIIYLNKSAGKLFTSAEADIRTVLPGFSAAALEGSSIDQFHRLPAHQARLLETLQQQHATEVEIGGRSIRILANPVIDENGQRLGTAVEWTDRTAEVAVEREIDKLVEAARAGNLEQRLELRDKQGFFHQLATGFNALLDQLSGVFDDIATVMGRLADGELRGVIEKNYEGTFDRVKQDVNSTLANLREIVGKIREVSEQLGASVDETATGNSNLSIRTEQQASSLQETASSMEELTATVRNNADNAQQANQLAAGARQTAERGGQVVSEAALAMGQISAASERIADIVGVIDEIASQTNLLALNASVEAARAGEQGRGFAVVATEVRNLASRSADAAKEVKALIMDSASKVRSGSELVNESGRTLDEIVESVKKVGDIVAEIAAASAEQAVGIDQVNQAISQMDTMTQQNAALAEQTAAASEAVSENAAALKQLVSFFRS